MAQTKESTVDFALFARILCIHDFFCGKRSHFKLMFCRHPYFCQTELRTSINFINATFFINTEIMRLIDGCRNTDRTGSICWRERRRQRAGASGGRSTPAEAAPAQAAPAPGRRGQTSTRGWLRRSDSLLGIRPRRRRKSSPFARSMSGATPPSAKARRCPLPTCGSGTSPRGHRRRRNPGRLLSRLWIPPTGTTTTQEYIYRFIYIYFRRLNNFFFFLSPLIFQLQGIVPQAMTQGTPCFPQPLPAAVISDSSELFHT